MPKVLIDMPDSFIKEHIENYEQGSLVDIAVRNALKHGIVLDGLTNGEVFLRLNETAQLYGIDKERDIIDVCFDNEYIVPISYSWWNRKWGETE